MADDLSQAAAAAQAVSEATTGADKPDAVSVAQKTPEAMAWALLGAGPALSAMAIVGAVPLYLWASRLIELLAAGKTANAADLAKIAITIVQAYAALVAVPAVLLGLVIWRLAGVKRLDVKAGPASATVES